MPTEKLPKAYLNEVREVDENMKHWEKANARKFSV